MTRADATGVEADLDVFDEHGTVLLTIRGLQLGTGASETGDRDRVLGERLLTIEWQQRTLPEAGAADARSVAAGQHLPPQLMWWPAS